AGPAGLTAALSATQHNLSYLLLDQQEPGGTILQYPRRKLVMTQPVEIPLYGKLKYNEYSKESLLEIWQEIIQKYQIQFDVGHKIEGVQRVNGYLKVSSPKETFLAKQVVLAMGRRGTPRKLNVSGEDSSKVAYQLIDAQAYTDTNVLVVGGGDSAIEAAVGLARQKGNKVRISYRKSKFFRIKKKNEDRINRLISQGRVKPIFNSNVLEIKEKSVRLQTEDEIIEIPNDYVFIFAGGTPPFKLLKEMGIQFGGEAKSLAEQA
nr:NAD(P)-binding domain-containing protein [Fodinibius sp.]